MHGQNHSKEERKYSHTTSIREQKNLVKIGNRLCYSGTLVCAYRAAPLVLYYTQECTTSTIIWLYRKDRLQ